MKNIYKIVYLSLSLVMAINLQAAGEERDPGPVPALTAAAGGAGSSALVAAPVHAIGSSVGSCIDTEYKRECMGAFPGYKDAVRTLLATGATVDSPDKYGRLPLKPEAYKSRSDIVELLLEAGITANVGKKNLTPLQIAAYEGHVEAVKVLLKAGARDFITSDGLTALGVAHRAALIKGRHSGSTVP